MELRMKYYIPGSYYSPRHALVSAWRKDNGYNQKGFYAWLKKQTGDSTVKGNFETGWTIEFDNEAKYTWFLLKWG
jgi:hypothetical protein